MAKKKNDDILEKLSALNPRVPTKTRSEIGKTLPEESFSKIEISKMDYTDLVRANAMTLQKMCVLMIDDAQHFQGTALKGWKRFFDMLTEMVIFNTRFLIEIIHLKK
jgi:hypothetical protein